MLTGLMFMYALLIIVSVATNFNFFCDFVKHDVQEEVAEISSVNNVTGKLLETLSILLFMLLYPIMMSVIILRGGTNKC
jgi:hypothetical protein